MELVNLTPHDVTLIKGDVVLDAVTKHWKLVGAAHEYLTIPSSGVARVTTEEVPDGEVWDYPIFNTKFGEITGLPEPAPDTLYIVSAIVLTAAKAAGRTDCVCVTHTIFGEDHKVIGAMRLSH